VTVVVPALNEELNLPHVFARIPADAHEVILVDGGSMDRTVEVARELRPSVIVVHQTRTGKGNALAWRVRAASTGDIIAMIDADGSTDPAEIPRFVDALLDGADFAKAPGSVGRGQLRHHRLRRWGNKGLNGVVNVLFGTQFTDLCYGYNAFWRRACPTWTCPRSTCRGRPTAASCGATGSRSRR